MAVPRVFVSSTYYDLKQYRSIIGDFIKNLGYEPIMHERSGVTYTQNVPLEIDCYHEIESCEIVVCIIGNHFGTQSSENDISITMNELSKALKTKAKIYVFIANDVYIENRTYRMNKDSDNFKSAYTDNIKIHKFISEIIERENSIVIQPFSSTDEIINSLKLQWAGLFQNLLARESSQTEAKTVYDLAETAKRIRAIVDDFEEEKNSFFQKFDVSYLTNNKTLTTIKKHIGLQKAAFFAYDLNSLEEVLFLVGFVKCDDLDGDEVCKYKKTTQDGPILTTITIGLGPELFEDNNELKIIRNQAIVDRNFYYDKTEDPIEYTMINDNELPF